MKIHELVLETVQDLCAERGDNVFMLNDVVRALPALNANTVRTQVSSYCCVNAKQHHAHRHPYFRRVGHGKYELQPSFRPRKRRRAARLAPQRDTVHALVTQSDGLYVAECLEVAVITQARTLDELMENLREAIGLHLEDEDAETSGMSPHPRLAVTYETALAG